MDTDIDMDTGAEKIDKTYKNDRKMKSKKVKGEVLDLQNGAAFLSGVKIRGGTGLFFFLRNHSPGINANDSCEMNQVTWSAQD